LAACKVGRETENEVLEDFSKYGPVEERELGRIQQISGPHLHKSWISIPHVTHFDEVDITELEAFRKRMNLELATDQPSYSLLVFITRALVASLKYFPLFNCSLVPGGGKVIIKNYYHIGIAVDTEGGLVVPVIKDVDKKGLIEIAGELQRLSSGARAGKLAIPDIQGATCTISSLGGIGGTAFTPIVNSPQVAILGLSRSYQKPVWDGEKFVPRLTLPFSVSYDHRVIDGAEAARFCKTLRKNIEDLKRTLL
jgi:pyruvate dehydrogenase E2 component (dihydrolipoamide acetyltransferase)